MGVYGPGVPSGRVTATFAPTASCPSRKTVAETVMTSPTTARAGQRPHETTGEGSVMGMGPIIGGDDTHDLWRHPPLPVAEPPGAARRPPHVRDGDHRPRLSHWT